MTEEESEMTNVWINTQAREIREIRETKVQDKEDGLQGGVVTGVGVRTRTAS
jgi:hypothetical protein